MSKLSFITGNKSWKNTCGDYIQVTELQIIYCTIPACQWNLPVVYNLFRE
jgi:hypothetical protein